MRAGIALNPGTPPDAVAALGEVADHILAMTVNPGWGGQAFIADSPAKVTALAELLPGLAIEVDGGVDAETVGSVADAGATLFVAGSAVFGSRRPGGGVPAIAEAAGAE